MDTHGNGHPSRCPLSEIIGLRGSIEAPRGVQLFLIMDTSSGIIPYLNDTLTWCLEFISKFNLVHSSHTVMSVNTHYLLPLF